MPFTVKKNQEKKQPFSQLLDCIIWYELGNFYHDSSNMVFRVTVKFKIEEILSLFWAKIYDECL